MANCNRGLHQFAIATVCATFALIVAGSLVTSNDAGLSVPDWPLSHGKFMPEMSGGVFYEHGHRMVAAFVGMMTIVLALWIWKVENRAWVRFLGKASAIIIFCQAILGGITVLFFLPTPVSVAHAFLAQLFFCIVICVAVVTSPTWINIRKLGRYLQARLTATTKLLRLCGVTTAALFVQLVLGAILRHTGTVEGTKGHSLVIWALIVHLLGAFIVTILMVTALMFFMRLARESFFPRLIYFTLGLLCFQWVLGVGSFMVRSDAANRIQPTAWKIWVTVSHVAAGALLLGVLVVLTLFIARYSFYQREHSVMGNEVFDGQVGQ